MKFYENSPLNGQRVALSWSEKIRVCISVFFTIRPLSFRRIKIRRKVCLKVETSRDTDFKTKFFVEKNTFFKLFWYVTALSSKVFLFLDWY